MTGIILFESSEIRRLWDEETETWYFAVVDVIEALTTTPKPRQYWFDMKRRGNGGNCRQIADSSL